MSEPKEPDLPALRHDCFAVNFMRLAGLGKHKARECETIVRQVLNEGQERSYGLACYEAGVRAGMEKATQIAEDISSYDEDDPGGSVAAAIRAEIVKGQT